MFFIISTFSNRKNTNKNIDEVEKGGPTPYGIRQFFKNNYSILINSSTITYRIYPNNSVSFGRKGVWSGMKSLAKVHAV
jgi:hypothetical protein